MDDITAAELAIVLAVADVSAKGLPKNYPHANIDSERLERARDAINYAKVLLAQLAGVK